MDRWKRHQFIFYAEKCGWETSEQDVHERKFKIFLDPLIQFIHETKNHFDDNPRGGIWRQFGLVRAAVERGSCGWREFSEEYRMMMLLLLSWGQPLLLLMLSWSVCEGGGREGQLPGTAPIRGPAAPCTRYEVISRALKGTVSRERGSITVK